MASYRYLAQNENGKRIRGIMTAADEQELHRRLRAQQAYLISAQEQRPVFCKKVLHLQALAEFNRQIGTLVGSGVSLLQALDILCRQEHLRPAESEAYRGLLCSIRQGVCLSQAMEVSGVFPEFLINMYKSAEAGGNLEQVAMRMALHYDKEWRLSTKVRNSVLYPEILSVLIVMLLCFIMGYVLPRFQELFSVMENLPFPTLIVMGISDVVSAHWLLLLMSAVILVLILRILLAVPRMRLAVDAIKLRIPGVGKLLKVIYTARFARTLSSLYASGISLTSGLEIARHTTGNSYIDAQFDDVALYIRNGGNLSNALHMVDGFIQKLGFSVRVGEETGALDSMLDSTADMLDYESEIALDRMVRLLEPTLIVIMAFIVGFIIVAVMLPVYTSYQNIGLGY